MHKPVQSLRLSGSNSPQLGVTNEMNRATEMAKTFAIICIIAIVCFAPRLGRCQIGCKAEAFEVASIRPSGIHSNRLESGGPGSSSPNLYRYSSATLLDLIGTAWSLDYDFIKSSVPLNGRVFDLIATLPTGSTRDDFRCMLRDLLANRFGLKAHLVSKMSPAYALQVTRSGLKVAKQLPGQPIELVGAVPSLGDPAPVELPAHVATVARQFYRTDDYTFVRLLVKGEPLSIVAKYLPKPDGLPVVDATDLKENVSFILEYAQDDQSSVLGSVSDKASIFTALREQLGLELRKRTDILFTFLIVDAIRSQPTEN